MIDDAATPPRNLISARHGASASGGTANILWCDGHASGMKINGNPMVYGPHYWNVLGWGVSRTPFPESLWDRDY
jgi:prepilin-type processing-associated H-X9-DG protein